MRRLRPLVLLAVPLVAAGALAARARLNAPPLPHLGRVPEFRLMERAGRPITPVDLQGRVWVADFIFTRCGGICPAMTARMARLQRDLPGNVAFVSFSVDPRHDTPDVLRRYAEAHRAGPGWSFVTGAQADLHRLAVEGFKLATAENPPGDPGTDGPFLHSAKFVLVDGQGSIRGYYDSDDAADMAALESDARRLAPASR